MKRLLVFLFGALKNIKDTILEFASLRWHPLLQFISRHHERIHRMKLTLEILSYLIPPIAVKIALIALVILLSWLLSKHQ